MLIRYRNYPPDIALVRILFFCSYSDKWEMLISRNQQILQCVKSQRW